MNKLFSSFILILIGILPSLHADYEIFSGSDHFSDNYLWAHANLIEDKIYLEPDSIYFSPNQIYVKIEGDLIPVEHLSCDRNGVFTSLKEIETGRAMQGKWQCKKCEYENYEGIDNCGLCGRYRYAKDEYSEENK